MKDTLLLLLGFLATVVYSERDEYHLRTNYYDETEIIMNWTANGRKLDKRVGFIENLVEEYKFQETTPKDKYNHLSFDELPLEEFRVYPSYRISAFESRTVYRMTFYISHADKLKPTWMTKSGFEPVYNWARLRCIITDADTYCTVAYSKPITETQIIVNAVVVVATFVIVMFVVAYLLSHRRRWRADLKITRSTSEPKKYSAADKIPILTQFE